MSRKFDELADPIIGKFLVSEHEAYQPEIPGLIPDEWHEVEEAAIGQYLADMLWSDNPVWDPHGVLASRAERIRELGLVQITSAPEAEHQATYMQDELPFDDDYDYQDLAA